MSRRDQTCIKAIQRKVNLLLICECSHKLTFEIMLRTAENVKKYKRWRGVGQCTCKVYFWYKITYIYIHCVCVCEKHCHGTVIYLPVGIFQSNYKKKIFFWNFCVILHTCRRLRRIYGNTKEFIGSVLDKLEPVTLLDLPS